MATPAAQVGRHNADLEGARSRLIRGGTYKDASTVIVVPTRGVIPVRVVESWMNLMNPMNQRCYRLFIAGHEVGVAYSQAIQTILSQPGLNTFRYVLTLEEDNVPPMDGVLKLIESLESDKRLGAVGGLYWTKGEGGQPMIYGDPNVLPVNFIPQVPVPNTLQYCRGLGMGFTLFRLKMFTDERLKQPWFETVQRVTPTGAQSYTQDLKFFEQAGAIGYRFACDTRVLVGHYDKEADITW